MSFFQVHQDQENQVSNIRRLKETKSSLAQPQERAVLGVINRNPTRPTRTAKQETKLIKNEIAIKKPLQKTTFTVHEDQFEEQAATLQDVRVTNPSAAVSCCNNGSGVLKNGARLMSTLKAVPRPALKEIINSTELSIIVEDKHDDDACETMSEGASTVDSPMSVDRSFTAAAETHVKQTLPELAIIYDVDEYRDDIFKYLKEAEKRRRPKANYMRRQPDVTYSMRAILVDWLVEVAEEYRLHPETLYMAITFIDRFLSLMSVVRGKLQLLGTAAMFIASKYEEIYPPDINEFVYITDDTYTKKQVLRMEILILKVLMFDLSVPTAYTFIKHLAVANDLSERVMFLAQYLLELSLLEGDPYLEYTPSLLACSSLALAQHCLGQEAWPMSLQQSSGYKLIQLALCVAHLNETHTKAAAIPQQAVREKYKGSTWQRVADVPHKRLVVQVDVSPKKKIYKQL